MLKSMVMRTGLAFLCLFTFCGGQLNAMNVKDFEKQMSDEKTQLMAGVYISGVGEGLLAANARAELSKNVRLFCIPRDLVLTTEKVTDIMNRRLKKMLSDGISWEKLGNYEVASIVLMGLEDTYPCSRR